MKIEKEVEKKPQRVSDRRFPRTRREYQSVLKELSRKTGVDRRTLEDAVAAYGIDVVKKAAEVEQGPRKSVSSILRGIWGRLLRR